MAVPESSPQKWVTPIAILAGALVVRLIYLYLFSYLSDWNLLTIDNWYHHNWALSILRGNVLGDTTYFRAPFYVWCLALVYAVFGVSLWAARMFGVLVGVALVGMTYLTARRVAGRRVAVIAAAIQTLCPIMISFEAELLLDSLFTLLVQVAFYLFLVWDERQSWRTFLLFSFAVGLAAITRPTILGLVPVVVVFVVWRWRHAPLSIVRYLLAGVLGLALTVGVVFIRNIVVADDPVAVASQGGINFYISNNPSADGLTAAMPEPFGNNWRIADITYPAERDMGRSLKPGQVSSYWSGKAFAWIKGHPIQFLQLYVKRLWFSIANIEISNNRLIPALFDRIWLLGYNPVRFGLLFALAVVGWTISWRRSRPARICFWFVIAFVLLNAVFFYNSRFRLPIVPVIIAVAAIAIDQLWQRRGRLNSRRTLVLGIAALVISFSPIYRLPSGFSTQEFLSRGLMEYNSSDFNSALEWYRQASSYDPDFPQTNLNIGAAFLRLGQVDSAEVYFRREIARYPDCAEALGNLGSIYLLRGDIRAARDFGNRSLAIKPYDPITNALLIRVALNDSARRPGDLWNQSQYAAKMTGNNSWVCLEAGTAMEQRGDYEHAEFMYHLAAGSAAPALETDDQMFESTYEQTLVRRRQEQAKANFAIGSLAGRQGEYAQAAYYSRRAIDLDSTQASPYVNLISAYLKLGEMHTADSALAAALIRFPDNRILRQLRNPVHQ